MDGVLGRLELRRHRREPHAVLVAPAAAASGASGAERGPGIGPSPAWLAQQEPSQLHQLVKNTWAASPGTRVQWDQFTSVYRKRGKGRARPEDVPRRVLLDFLRASITEISSAAEI